MSESCRSRRDERYEVRDDAVSRETFNPRFPPNNNSKR